MATANTEVPKAVGFLLDRVVEHFKKTTPDYVCALFVCSIPRWFNRQIVEAMCAVGKIDDVGSEDVLRMLQSLPFSTAHPNRPSSWTLNADFRTSLMESVEIGDELKLALNQRSATLFKEMLEDTKLHGQKRFKDSNWRELAADWIHHLLKSDPSLGVITVRRICAEALAIPVYGPSWEIDFCVRFLDDLDWSEEGGEVTDAISSLKEGFALLAAEEYARALPMVVRLVDVTGLSAEHKCELHLFIGQTYLDDESRMMLALNHYDLASELNPTCAESYLGKARVYKWPGRSWGRLDLAEDLAEQSRRMAQEQDSSSDKAEAYTVLGDISLELEAWRQAIEWYDEAVKFAKHPATAYFALSDAYSRSAKCDQALTIIDKAMEGDPYIRHIALVQKANILSGARRFSEALKQLRIAQEEEPEQIVAIVAMGQVYEKMRRSINAEEQYRAAIEKNPAVDDGYVSLAKLYNDQGKWERAVNICKQAIDAGVSTKAVYIILTQLHSVRNQIQQVKAAQQEIVRLDSMAKYASHCVIGDALLETCRGEKGGSRQKLLDEALSEFDKAIVLDDRRAWAYMSLAQEAVLRGENDSIQRLRDKVKELTPWALYDFLVILGAEYLANHKGEQAEEVLNAATVLASHREDAWVMLRALYSWQGDLENMTRVESKLDVLNPCLAYETKIVEGETLLRMHDFAGARKAYEEAIAYAEDKTFEPDKAVFHVGLASIDEAEGKSDDAIARYRMAAEEARDLASVCHARIAALHREQQEDEAAEKAARLAIESDPEAPDGYIALALVGAATHPEGPLVDEATVSLSSRTPNNAYDLDYALGEAYREASRYDMARKRYQSCIDSHEDRIEAIVGLARLFVDEGNYEDAEKQLCRAKETDETSVQVYAAFSQLYEKKGNAIEVRNAQEEIVRLEPTARCDASLIIGLAFEKANKLKQAENYYREAAKLCSWRPEPFVRLGSLLRTSGAPPDEVSRLYKQACSKAGMGYLDLGLYYENQEKPEDALNVYRLGIEYEQSKDTIQQLYTALALTQHRLKRDSEAEAALKNAIVLDPTKADPYWTLMELLIILNQVDRAKDTCRRMAEQPEFRWSAYVSLGDLLTTNEKYEAAESAYKKAIEQDPNVADAYVRLARVYMREGSFDAASLVLRRALEFAPTNSQVHAISAELHWRQGDLDEASRRYRRAADIEPDGETASILYENAGDLLIEQRRYDEAEELLQKAVARNPSNGGAFFSRGKTQERLDDLDLAAEMYRQAIKLIPKYKDAYVALGRVFGKQADGYSLENLAQRIISISPADEYEARLVVAEMYEAAGEIAEAERTIRTAVDLNPKRSLAYIALGRLLQRQQRADESIECHLLAAELSHDASDASKAYEAAGDLLNYEARYEDATDALLKATSSDPSNAGAYISLGLANERQDQLDQAREAYFKALKADQNYMDAYLAIGRIYGKENNHEGLSRIVQQIETLDLSAEYEARLISEVYREAGDVNQQQLALGKAIEHDGTRPEAYRDLIHSLINQHRLDEAVRTCEQMAEQPGISYDAHILLGNLLTSQSRSDEAATAFRRATDIDPSRPEAYAGWAQICEERKEQWDRAIDLYLMASDRYGDLVDASATFARVGELFSRQERYEEAVESWQKSVRFDPTNATAHYELGVAYERQGEVGKAEKAFAKAIDNAREYRAAYLALGCLYAEQGDVAGIVRVASRIQSLFQDNYLAHTSVAEFYITANQHEWALDELKKAVSHDPERWEAHADIGVVHEARGDWALARAAYTEVARLNPELQSGVHIRAGSLFLKEGNSEEAENEYKAAVHLDPEQWGSYLTLAGFYQNFSRWDEAIQVLNDMARLGPAAAISAYLQIASLYRKLGRVEDMRNKCAEVVSLVEAENSPNGDLLRQHGLAHLMRREYSEAAQSLARAIEMNSDDVQAHFYLALTLCQEQSAEAQSQLDLGIELSSRKSDYVNAIEEAEALATDLPEVKGARQMLDKLNEARDTMPE